MGFADSIKNIGYWQPFPLNYILKQNRVINRKGKQSLLCELQQNSTYSGLEKVTQSEKEQSLFRHM